MATKKVDKYADFQYEISDVELEEAKWLIEQGDFKDLDDFIEGSRRAEIRMMKRADAEKKKKAETRHIKRAALNKKKAA